MIPLYRRKYKINGHDWNVGFRRTVDDNERVDGLCDTKRRVIHIKKDLEEIEKISTLIHEILHAFEYEYNIKISHRAIYRLERAILEFYMVNFT